MLALPRYILFFFLKLATNIFYQFECRWLHSRPQGFENIKIFLLLNHTSLFEPLLVGAFPNNLLWQIAKRFVYPIADKTYKRPLVGKIFKSFAPHTISLTRKRDSSWDKFVNLTHQKNCLIGLAPEGRMKRPNGLDKNGQPMNIKGGITELLEKIQSGKMLVLYSGGLHHIQTPGSGFPKLFKKINLKFESLDINQYKDFLKNVYPDKTFAMSVITDLQARRDFYCSDIKLKAQSLANSEFIMPGNKSDYLLPSKT